MFTWINSTFFRNEIFKYLELFYTARKNSEKSTLRLEKFRLHVKASPDSPDSPDSPKRFFEKYDVFLIENGKISDFKLF